MAGVTIQELGLRFVDACMRLYWGSCWYPLLFAVGLICTLVLGRKRKSGIFVGYTVFLLLTVYNPLVVKYLIAKVKFENEYYRFIWILADRFCDLGKSAGRGSDQFCNGREYL